VAAATIALPRLYFQSPALLLGMLPLLGGIGPNVAWITRRLGRLNGQPSAPAPGPSLNHPTAAAGTVLRP
jgi:hypothetical protein